MDDYAKLLDELQGVPSVANLGRALVDFARASSSGDFTLSRGGRWIFRPCNFVAFKVQPRSRNIVLYLKAYPRQMSNVLRQELELGSYYSGHTECRLDHPSQLAAAAAYVMRAHEIAQLKAG